ncbi:MAG TPA: FAD-dependent oxidoreductase [Methanoregulaceae archaeon]|nr:FAD-dependent oxidoreductase [Methanoregulaceae archaeon]HQJ88143.1 FAD-dependent oxidoreductase [Methanoregulaceae archaeon]
MPKVVVYFTENCPYCRMVKAFLDQRKVPYRAVNVGTDRQAAREMIERSGQYGVPVTVVDEEVIVGYDAKRLGELFGEDRQETSLDVLIVGAGPAGLTAGVYCARKGLRTLIISTTIGGQALESWAIENYMGFRMIKGEDLMHRFEEQVRAQNIRLELDRVTGVTREDGRFRVTTEGNRAFKATSLIVASGRHPKSLGVADEHRFLGRGLSVCATCDGPLFRDKRVAVIGGGNAAVQIANELAGIAAHVDVVVRSDFRADAADVSRLVEKANVTVHRGWEVAALHGDAFLSGLTIRERNTSREVRLDEDGVFVDIGWEPNTDFLGGLVQLNERNEIVVDENCHTSIPGLYAAGDVTSIHSDQIIIAAGEGAKAALEAFAWVRSQG